MDENTVSVPVVYQGGIFVPEQDVSFLAEGTRLELHVPAPPDEWDELLEQVVAEAAVANAAGVPEALDWMVSHAMAERWVALPTEDAGKVIDVERLLGWQHSKDRDSALLL